MLTRSPTRGLLALPCCVGLALCAAGATGACIAPVSTGGPQRAATLGQGGVQVDGHLELPSVNLVAAGDSDKVRAEGLITPIAAVRAAAGLTDRLDLEGGIDMPLYFLVVPIPNSLWGGLRWQFVENETIDLAGAAQVGGVVLGEVSGDVESDESADALFGALSLSSRLNLSNAFKPGLSARYAPYRVRTEDIDNVDESFHASIATLTAYFDLEILGYTRITPFVSASWFHSPNLDSDSAQVISGGLSLAFMVGGDKEPTASAQEPPSPAFQSGPPGAGI